MTRSGWWFGTFFPYIENFIIPTDFHIFAEGLKPPTSRWYLFPCPKPMWVGITNFRQGFPSGITFGTSACEGGPLPWDEKWDQKVPVRVPWHLTKIAGIYGCSCNYICIYTNIYIYKNSIYGGPMRTHKYVYIIRYHDL